MALIVEDGTGLSTADAYDSVANVDSYIENYMTAAQFTTWDALTTAQRETAIRKATSYLDLRYGRRYRGYRANETQALAWPRSDVYDYDGYAVEDNVVPTAVKQACAEVAVRVVVDESLILPDVSTPVGDIEQEKVVVGPIQIDTKYAGAGDVAHTLFQRVDALLLQYIRSVTQIERA